MTNFCATTCPVVTEAVKAASPESRLEMAIIAIESEKISQREAASRFDVSRRTLKRTLSDRQLAQTRHLAVDKPQVIIGKDGKHYKPPATEHEINEAIRLKKEGFGTNEIAKQLNRGASTIREWIAKNKNAEQQNIDATPQVIVEPQKVANDQKLKNTKKVLPQLAQNILQKETKCSLKRALQLQELKTLSEDMDALWRFAQQRFDKDGRSVLRNHMGLADEAMAEIGLLMEYGNSLGFEQQPTYLEILLEVDRIAKDVSASVRKAVYLFGYFDSIPD
jgi:transposase